MKDDTISRQAAIDICNFAIDFWRGQLGEGIVIAVRKRIEQLPTVQSEIIRCKDCKNSEHWYGDRRRCFLWAEDGVSVFDDGFCNYAERRTDASD